MEDITSEIDITIRPVKDVEYACPKCKHTNTLYDVDTGEYTENQCHKCGYQVKFYVSDFM